MSSKTRRRLLAELHAMLDPPDERKILEEMIAYSMLAGATVRRILGPDVAPLVPANVVELFRELRGITHEAGAAWSARVDRVLAMQEGVLNGERCDAAAVRAVRALVVGK